MIKIKLFDGTQLGQLENAVNYWLSSSKVDVVSISQSSFAIGHAENVKIMIVYKDL